MPERQAVNANVYTRAIDAMILDGRVPTSTIAAAVNRTPRTVCRRREALRAKSAALSPIEAVQADERATLLREEIRQLEAANRLDHDRIRQREQWIAQKLQQLGGVQ